MYTNPYIKHNDLDKNVKLRLFCLPYAGANSAIFSTWNEKLSDDIEVISIQLPARANRFLDNVIEDMDTLVSQIYEAIEPLLSEPFALFGHSMGGMIAYALSQKIETENRYRAKKVIISATKVPEIYARIEHKHLLSDTELIKVLRDNSVTPSEVLDSDEMMQLLLPTIRADYKLVETYTPTCKAKLQTEVIVFNSEEDITKEDMLLWQNYFEHSVQYQAFNGGHFFIHSDEKSLLEKLDGLFK